LIRYDASWVVPIAGRPLRDGWVSVDGGRVIQVGAEARPSVSETRDLGPVAIMPGLVNAHTHLELSYMRGRVPPAAEFVAWIRSVVAARRQYANPDAADIVRGVEEGIAEAIRCGTALVGDISNTLITFDPLAASPLGGVVFHELIRFNAPDPSGFVDAARRRVAALPHAEHVRACLAAHAPYSVAPSVFDAIRGVVDRDPSARCSVHLCESADEIEFIRTGTGAWRTFLEDVGAWDPQWLPPGGSPVQYLDATGFFDHRVLAVHGVQMTRDDLERLAARGTTLVTCPRSNRQTGVGDPPLVDFYRSGARVAVGTDSLASAPDLNVFAELAAMRALAPSVPASWLLDSATRQGAVALGFDADYGTIEPGKVARLLAVSIPDGLDDVEEYLVSGVEPHDVVWLDE
jgi:cytosine/adenosine deaminase-related metal-dependent hydrolase